MSLSKKDKELILITILLFLIFFVLLPLSIYSTGANESTNYYYRLNETAKNILPHIIEVIKLAT